MYISKYSFETPSNFAVALFPPWLDTTLALVYMLGGLYTVLIIVLDVAVFFIPVTGIVAAWVLLARPPWFREWVDRLYAQG